MSAVMSPGATVNVAEAAAQVDRYTTRIFDPSDWAEIRLIPNKSIKGARARSEWAPAGKLAGMVRRLANANAAGFNVHVGVNPRTGHGAKGDAGVALARCLFVDFDNTGTGDAFARIADARLPAPTLTIGSGHGVHAYWRLREPMTDLSAWTEMQKDLIALLGTDKVIFNPERVMRMPGFLNVKTEPAVPVLVVEEQP